MMARMRVTDSADEIATGHVLFEVCGPVATITLNRPERRNALSMAANAHLHGLWSTIDADPTQMLEWGLHNADSSVRMQAVWLVGERQDRKYLKVIGPMLKDSDSGIRAMASWAIVRILGDQYDAGVEI